MLPTTYQAVLLWLQIVVQAIAFSSLSQTTAFPVAVVLIGAVGLVAGRRWRIPAAWQRGLVLAALAVCIFKWVVAPYEPPRAATFAGYPLAHVLTQFALVLQTGAIWSRSPTRPLYPAWPVCGVLVFILMAGLFASPRQQQIYEINVALFCCVTAFYCGTGRLMTRMGPPRQFGRWGLSAAALVVALFAGGMGSGFLHDNWYALERLIGGDWGGEGSGTIGFSKQGQLGSVQRRKSDSEEEIALRVFTESAPGYLRGGAFDRFNGRQWSVRAARRRTIPPLPPDSAEQADPRSLFPLHPLPETGWTTLEVQIDSPTEVMFSPLGTARVAATAASISVDPHETIEGYERAGDQLYRLDVSPTPPVLPITSEYRENMLQVEHLWDPQVPQLAERLFQGLTTPEEKIAAVEEYFHREYQYEMGIQVPSGRHPLEYFLLDRPAAHCEYFASGAALLLRMGGVPCRYVCGFVAAEQNPYGNYWIARNRDAHAWAEAYVPDRGWVIVEATPSQGVPETRASYHPAQWWDDLRQRLQAIRRQFTAGGWQGVRQGLAEIGRFLTGTVVGWGLMLGLILWSAILLRRLIRWWTAIAPQAVEHPMRPLLREMDRRLERRRLERARHETLHQFAERLRQTADAETIAAADWYERYARLRYGTTSVDQALAELEQMPQGL